MVAWFIIAIATLAVFALIAVNGVQTVAATTDGVGRIETSRRLDAAAAALIARAGSPASSGKYFVLAGSTVDGVYGLPTEMSSYATTPFGQRIVYCPFGDNEAGSTSGSVPQGGGLNYTIQLRSDAQGRAFVTNGRPPLAQVVQNPNLMGYLIAPRTKSSTTATCSQVRYNPATKRFEAPDSLVRPIIRGAGTEEARASQGREVVFYVDMNANATGRGLTPAEPTTFTQAIDYYRTRQPDNMRIVLANGNYPFATNSLNKSVAAFANRGASSNLTIVNNDTGATLDQVAAGTVNIPGNLYLQNVAFASTTQIIVESGRSLVAQTTTLGPLAVLNGGGATISNSVVQGSAAQQQAIVALSGGHVAVTGNNTFRSFTNRQIYVGGGSTLTMSGAVVSLTGASNNGVGIDIGTGGTVDIVGSAVTMTQAQNAFVNNAGSFSLTAGSALNSNAQNTSQVLMAPGSKTSISGSTMTGGTMPANAFYDGGALTIDGSGIVRSASSCWNKEQGSLFEQGDGHANGSSSDVWGDTPPPAMSASPTNAEVQAYSAAVAANQKRSMLRQSNKSNFTCSTS